MNRMSYERTHVTAPVFDVVTAPSSSSSFTVSTSPFSALSVCLHDIGRGDGSRRRRCRRFGITHRVCFFCLDRKSKKKEKEGEKGDEEEEEEEIENRRQSSGADKELSIGWKQKPP